MPRDADARAIKRAFRALTLRYHPDRNPAAHAEERFKEIAQAYAALTERPRRAARVARAGAERDLRRHEVRDVLDLRDLFAGLEGALIDAQELLADFAFSLDGRARRARPRRPAAGRARRRV